MQLCVLKVVPRLDSGLPTGLLLEGGCTLACVCCACVVNSCIGLQANSCQDVSHPPTSASSYTHRQISKWPQSKLWSNNTRFCGEAMVWCKGPVKPPAVKKMKTLLCCTVCLLIRAICWSTTNSISNAARHRLLGPITPPLHESQKPASKKHPLPPTHPVQVQPAIPQSLHHTTNITAPPHHLQLYSFAGALTTPHTQPVSAASPALAEGQEIQQGHRQRAGSACQQQRPQAVSGHKTYHLAHHCIQLPLRPVGAAGGHQSRSVQLQHLHTLTSPAFPQVAAREQLCNYPAAPATAPHR